jgi:flagellar biosynthesis/type III secretory pathway protein FliH
VRGALRGLIERERVTVLVHPDDLETMRAAIEELRASLGGVGHCEVQAERRVGRGGAIVRTPDGDVDARLETKLERVREVVETQLGGELAVAAGEAS